MFYLYVPNAVWGYVMKAFLNVPYIYERNRRNQSVWFLFVETWTVFLLGFPNWWKTDVFLLTPDKNQVIFHLTYRDPSSYLFLPVLISNKNGTNNVLIEVKDRAEKKTSFHTPLRLKTCSQRKNVFCLGLHALRNTLTCGRGSNNIKLLYFLH